MGLLDEIGKQEIIQLYEQGLTCREVAAKLGISKSTVSYWIRFFGISQKRVKFYNQDSAMEMYEDFLNEMTIAELAKKYNVKKETITSVLFKYFHVSLSGKNELIIENGDDILAMYENGSSVEEICNKYNISVRPLVDYLRGLEVEVRSSDNHYLNVPRDRRIIIKKNYFDCMDNYKAYVLGILFSGCSENKKALTRRSILFISSIDNTDCIDTVKNELYETERKPICLSSDNTFKIPITDDYFVKVLYNKYGMFNKIKLDPKYKKSFMDGFLYKNLKIIKVGISINIRNVNYFDYIYEYLVNDIGIDKYSITENKTSIVIRNAKEYVKIFFTHKSKIGDILLSDNHEKAIKILQESNMI